MDVALLVLRLLLGVLLLGHGLQKAFGWFRGPGPAVAAGLFETWGFRPGRPMVAVAACCEIAAGVLLCLGFLTPLGAAVTVGTMVVAAAPNRANGLWAAHGGYELPLVYAGLGVVLALGGPGGLSVDAAVGISTGPWVGVLAVLVGLVAAAVPLARRRSVLAGAAPSPPVTDPPAAPGPDAAASR